MKVLHTWIDHLSDDEDELIEYGRDFGLNLLIAAEYIEGVGLWDIYEELLRYLDILRDGLTKLEAGSFTHDEKLGGAIAYKKVKCFLVWARVELLLQSQD